MRTPLATVHGFTRTMVDRPEIGDPFDRYLRMIDTAAVQLGGLIDRLGLASRIVDGRYEPDRRETNTLELAESAAARLTEGQAVARGQGAQVLVDPVAAEQALADLALAAARHGGLEQVALTVTGAEIAIEPVGAEVAPILLGQDLRDLGSAVAGLVVEAQGGSVDLDGDRLVLRWPAAPL